MKRALLTFTFIAFLLAACGAPSEPTMSAADVQGTAVAAAWTMVAETQAAMPTETPIPPTPLPSPTPLPTNTVPPLDLPTLAPTQPIAVQPSPTTQSSGDDCNHLLDPNAPGPTFPLKIINETKAQVNVSIYLSKTAFGECGYIGVSLNSKGSTLITFPQGVIYGYAWINDPKKPTTVSGGPWTANNPDKWTVYIRDTKMIMAGP